MSFPQILEDESIYIIREAYSQFTKPVVLFSGGKDSTVLVHLIRKAFYPAKFPFPLIHVDTGHNFNETIEFRDSLVKKYDLELIVGSVQEYIDNGTIIEDQDSDGSRNHLQSKCLLETLRKNKVDAAIGGARRDEEKARAKERIFSHRDKHGYWDPKNQRPEISNIYNGRNKEGEHFRIYPLSNWTEMDIWQYIKAEKIQIPTLYFAHKRKVFKRNGMLLSESEFIKKTANENTEEKTIRFRTIGDISCTGAMLSSAATIDDIISELKSSTEPERGDRKDDTKSETSMEDRKKEGYF